MLNVYRRDHFTKIAQLLDPTLEQQNPSWFALILEVVDAILFGIIIATDVAYDSTLRNGCVCVAARIHGSSQMINQTYLRIFQAIKKCQAEKPSAVPFILDSLTQIHNGSSSKILIILFHTERLSQG
jgi:hypothetical protein